MPAGPKPRNIVEEVLVIAHLDAVLEPLAEAGQFVVHQDLPGELLVATVIH
jgi:hypothetical protein